MYDSQNRGVIYMRSIVSLISSFFADSLVQAIVYLSFFLSFFPSFLPSFFLSIFIYLFISIHCFQCSINPLNPELNPICYLLALLAHHFLHVSRIRVKSLSLRILMSYIYIYGAHILDVSRSHTTTHHSR